MKQIIVPALLISLCFFKGNAKDNTHKNNYLGTNFYYNNHNQYFTPGFMLDVNYEYVFNRWVGLQTSLGFNRAKTKLNDWKKDVKERNYGYEYPNLTSSILFNLVGNFYCINNVHNKLKLGFGVEYRNITDALTIGAVDLLPEIKDESTLYPNTRFEQFNDLGFSGNISYQYVFDKGIGINSTFGYNYYFTDMSKKAKRGERLGGSSFLKLGIGVFYSFK